MMEDFELTGTFNLQKCFCTLAQIFVSIQPCLRRLQTIHGFVCALTCIFNMLKCWKCIFNHGPLYIRVCVFPNSTQSISWLEHVRELQHRGKYILIWIQVSMEECFKEENKWIWVRCPANLCPSYQGSINFIVTTTFIKFTTLNYVGVMVIRLCRVL